LRPNINGIQVPFNKNTNELVEMLDCELPLFQVACEALSAKNDKLSFLTLVSILEDNDPFKRRIGIECLGNHVMFEKALDCLLSCLDDKSPYVVRTAIEIIVKHRVVKSREKIIRLLKARDEATREMAVAALEYIANPSDFDLVLNLYSDKNKKIRNLAPYIVFATASGINWNKAYNLMKHSDNEKARLISCKLLYKFGTEAEKNDVKLFLQDKDGHIRKLANKIIKELE